ncbi:hypothetical protein FQN60_014495 [Etheostoma spectabile]|uniref:Uncharacterized protein n=1 Tax=Etheostoma spectabile TaxID=54343 RepID=A0A5J5DDN1_9PERO|nr:hypothetical protein FQN60_014495 [Etheostoma spectabile]
MTKRIYTGAVLTHPKKVNTRFIEFYSELYTSNCNHDTDEIRLLLSGLNLPHFSSEAKAVLDKAECRDSRSNCGISK